MKMAFEQISIQLGYCFPLIEKKNHCILPEVLARQTTAMGAIPIPGSASSIDLTWLTTKASRDTAVNNEQQPLYYQLAPYVE